MIKAVVIDDEPVAANVLQLMIERHVPEIVDLRIAVTIAEANALVRSFEPDILFLDIVMPEQNGFEFLSALTDIKFETIFTTAFDEYAIRALKFSAFDYLLKPIDANELRDTVQRFVQKKQQQRSNQQLLDNLISNLQKQSVNTFKLAVPSLGKTLFFMLSNIVRLEAEGNYTRFYLLDATEYLSSKTLKEYADILSQQGFIRIHKSHMVNKQFIDKYYNEGILVLANGIQLPVSRQRRQLVKTELASVS